MDLCLKRIRVCLHGNHAGLKFQTGVIFCCLHEDFTVLYMEWPKVSWTGARIIALAVRTI